MSTWSMTPPRSVTYKQCGSQTFDKPRFSLDEEKVINIHSSISLIRDNFTQLVSSLCQETTNDNNSDEMKVLLIGLAEDTRNVAKSMRSMYAHSKVMSDLISGGHVEKMKGMSPKEKSNYVFRLADQKNFYQE